MTEDQDVKDTQPDPGSKTFTNRNKDKKIKTQRPLTKIVLRRLPPTMTEESFLEQVSPIPEHDHFYFSKPDPSLGNNLFSRAYINFVNIDEMYLFKDKFDGYVFLDEKGIEYVGIVEYAPFQRIPKKKKKKDPKCGTIESDPIYQEFLESFNKDQETDSQPKLEYSYPIGDGKEKVQSTPLLEYLNSRKQDKRGRDERRRRENDKRKMRFERKTKDSPIKEEEHEEHDVKKIKSREWEKDRSSNKHREDYGKSDSKEGTVFESKTFRDQRKLNQSGNVSDKKKKMDGEPSTKDDDNIDDTDKVHKKDKRDKFKEEKPIGETKIKKYSDTRKDRMKQSETMKSDKQSVINKFISGESKTKTLNHDDIKPFTQLPHVKTDDLSKIIDNVDKKLKLDEKKSMTMIENNESDDEIVDSFQKSGESTGRIKIRRNSVGSGEVSVKDELVRQNSLDDRSKSTDREGSEEKEKSESTERRTERRIRNKDRPSLVIYQPGMGKFSKQRLGQKDTQQPVAKSVNGNEKKDT